MTWIRRWWRDAILVLLLPVAAFAAGRAITAWLGADVASYDAGAVATFIGILVGAPLAVRIALHQQANARTDQKRADDERRSALLALIGDDLLDTLADLESRMPRRDRSVTPFLGSGLYPMLQASGEMSLIRDAELLRAISWAYDRIGVTAYLERQSWETEMNPLSRRHTEPPQTIIEEARRYVANQDEHTHAAIGIALQVMRRPLRV